MLFGMLSFRCLILEICETYDRSMPINIEDIGTVYIRMCPPSNSPISSPHLISVDIVLEHATVFIRLSPNRDSVWPFSIENDSVHEVSFAQTVGIILGYHMDRLEG